MGSLLDCDGSFSIDVSVGADALHAGYVARLVIRALPDMRELLREDLGAFGRTWPQPESALKAAVLRGQQLVRGELCRRHAESVSDTRSRH